VHDLADDPDTASMYECLGCGAIVESQTHPGECADCGESFQNRAMSLE